MRAPVPHHRVMAAADRAEARAEARADGGGSGHPPRPPVGDVADADPPERPEKPERREGRGRLSSMDLAAELAPEDITWALAELTERRRSAEDIRLEMNDRLAVHGIEPISRSAFNRKSLKLAKMTNRLNEARFIFKGVAPHLTPERVDENTVALGEFIKTLCLELSQEDASEIGTKGAMELARAQLAVIQAQKLSADRRTQLQREFAQGAAKAIDAVAKEKGLTGETVRGIKEKILGLKLPPAPGAPA